MGTASLVFGLILIGFGLYATIDMMNNYQSYDEEDKGNLVLIYLITTTPMLVIGGLLLRKFDRDRQKSKNS